MRYIILELAGYLGAFVITLIIGRIIRYLLKIAFRDVINTKQIISISYTIALWVIVFIASVVVARMSLTDALLLYVPVAILLIIAETISIEPTHKIKMNNKFKNVLIAIFIFAIVIIVIFLSQDITPQKTDNLNTSSEKTLKKSNDTNQNQTISTPDPLHIYDKPIVCGKKVECGTQNKMIINVVHAKLTDFIKLLAEESGCHVVVASNVSGYVTMQARDILWYHVLERIQKTNNLSCDVTGDTITISNQEKIKESGFKDNGDGTITDLRTGLMWTKDANLAGRKFWSGAKYYITSINSGSGMYGYTNWRLPDTEELKSLFKDSDGAPYVWLTKQGFTDVQSNFYWSSTSGSDDKSNAWLVSMGGGFVFASSESYNHSFYVWPVRSGQ